MAMIGMFSAVATILMLFDFPLPFAPGFYKLDFSELPILVGTFAFGPAAGVMMEFVKILLKLFIKGTSTAFVGDLANFVIGCSFILPASVLYTFRKSKKTAMIACCAGILCMTVFGSSGKGKCGQSAGKRGGYRELCSGLCSADEPAERRYCVGSDIAYL